MKCLRRERAMIPKAGNDMSRKLQRPDRNLETTLREMSTESLNIARPKVEASNDKTCLDAIDRELNRRGHTSVSNDEKTDERK